MKNTWRSWAATMMAATLLGSSAMAATRSDLKGSTSIGPRIMYYEPKDADEGSWHGGAQIRFHMSPALALEGSVDYRDEEFGTTEVRTWPVQATLLAFLGGGTLTPFLLGGGGWYFTTIDPEGASSDTDGRFGFHAGGGLELALSDYWTLSGSYRYLWLEEFRTRLATLEEAEFDDSGHMIVGSLNYHF